MNDFERVARVIRFLDKHHVEQPDLETLARQVKLSPSHFHRLFFSWAGVTPKDFLQCLTVHHVRNLLRTGESVMNAALQAGLSGPGRAHDLCVTLEAASPGELKSGGANWTIEAGFARSPFGDCLIAESPRGICHLSFIENDREDIPWKNLEADWPRAKLHRNDTFALQRANEIFARPIATGRRSTLRAFVKGSEFQVRVWRALMEIPRGSLTTYGRIAATIGQPTAARAVGSAVGANEIAILIPCHRVIRESGIIGDYRWGSIRKQALVAWEGSSRRTLSTGCRLDIPCS